MPTEPPRAVTVRDEMVLRFARGVAPDSIRAVLDAHGLVPLAASPHLAALGYVRVRVPEHATSVEQAALLRGEKRLRVAEPNRFAYAAGAFVDAPAYLNPMEFAIDPALAGLPADVLVAVLDTGVNGDLPAFNGRCLPGIDVTAGATGAADRHGHGTFCAALIAAGGPTESPLCPPARILPVKVLNDQGCGTYADVAAGIVAAADRGADVICLGLGGPESSALLQDAVAYARQRGCILIAAAGNDGDETACYPAGCAGVLGVSAVDGDLAPWIHSSRGRHVSACAPGVDVVSLDAAGARVRGSGTSAAAALASAAAALVRAHRKDLQVAAVSGALLRTALDLGAPGWDPVFGHGLLRAAPACSSEPAPVHDVAVAHLGAESRRVESGDRLFLVVRIENLGPFAEPDATVRVSENGQELWTETVKRLEDRHVVALNLGIPTAAPAVRRFEAIVTIPAPDHAPANNRAELVYTGRPVEDGQAYVLLKHIPFVHAWVTHEAYGLLPDGPLKNELSGYLRGEGVSPADLFASNMIWAATCSPPAAWASGPETGASVLEGSYDEDTDDYGITMFSDEDAALEHFWGPDAGYDHGLRVSYKVTSWRNHSALWRAHRWWRDAIETYPANKARAWWCLGRAAHLLADMGVPEHVHNDEHPSDDVSFFTSEGLDLVAIDFDDFSNYEEYTKIFYHAYRASGAPKDVTALSLELPADYVPADYASDFCRLFYNMAQYTQHFDSSDDDGNAVGYGGTPIAMGLVADAGTKSCVYPAITYRNGRADGIDPYTAVSVRWEKLGLWGYYLHKNLQEGPTTEQPDHYFDLCRGEGAICVPRSLWDPMSLTDRFRITYTFRGTTKTENIYDFEDWSDKAGWDYFYVPDRLAAAQAAVLMPESMRYTAALYQLFWSRVHPPPSTPGAVTASDGSFYDHVRVTWNNVAGETGYAVLRASAVDGPYAEIATLAADVTEYADPLACGSTAWYRVKATGLGGVSDLSPAARGGTARCRPVTPPGVTASLDTYRDRIRLAWTGVADADGYTVCRADTLTGVYAVIATLEADQTQYEDPRPCGWITAYYKVRAFNTSGASPDSPAATGRTGGCANNEPQWLDASDGLFTDRIAVAWDNVEGELRYVLYAKKTQYFLPIATTGVDEVTYDDPMPCGSVSIPYHVMVQYTNGTWSQNWPLDYGRTGRCVPTQAPTNVLASDGAFADWVEVRFAAVPDAEGYALYRADTAEGAYTFIAQNEGVAPSLQAYDRQGCGGPTRYYKVAARNESGQGPLSAADAGWTQPCPPPPPEALAASRGDYGDFIRLSWSPVSGASAYRLYRAEPDGGAFALRASLPGGTLYHEDAAACGGTAYRYRVSAVANGMESPPSVETLGETGVCPPDAPADVAASDGEYTDRIRLGWSDVDGETEYVVERSPSGAEAAYVVRARLSANTTVFEDPVACGGTSHWYRIQARNAGGASKYSEARRGASGACMPHAPTDVCASDGEYEDAILVRWTPPPDAVKARILVAVSEGGARTPASEWLPADEPFLHTHQEPGALRYYWVQVSSEQGESEPGGPDTGWAGREEPRTVATPVLSACSALSTGVLWVSVACTTPDATTHYTTNGATPTQDDPPVVAGGIDVPLACTLSARAWRDGWWPSGTAQWQCQTTSGDTWIAAAGDAAGCVTVVSLPAGHLLARTRLREGPAAKLAWIDCVGDGQRELVVAHFPDVRQPLQCLDLRLQPVWRSEEAVAYAEVGGECAGGWLRAADVDGDARGELVVPLSGGAPDQPLAYGVLDAATGRCKQRFETGFQTLGHLYCDPDDGLWHLAGGAPPEPDAPWQALNLLLPDGKSCWSNAASDLGRCGGNARLGPETGAMLWGGRGGQFFALHGCGDEAWRAEVPGERIGGVLLRNDVDPDLHLLLLEGDQPADGVRVPAHALLGGAWAWSYTAKDAAGYATVAAVLDVNGDGMQDAIILTGLRDGATDRSRIHCVNGADGTALWTREADAAVALAPQGRLADVTRNGHPELILAENHTLVILDTRKGEKLGSVALTADITTFDVSGGFLDADGDGQYDWQEEVAGTDADNPEELLRIVDVRCDGRTTGVKWSGAQGRFYAVAVATNLPAGFRVLTRNVAGAAPHTAFVDEEVPATPRFYRVFTHE
jgi:hypothetical protein